jgi:hypothetical protein
VKVFLQVGLVQLEEKVSVNAGFGKGRQVFGKSDLLDPL